MNKVYKVIWSKVKHCYVVASEFAKTNGKSPSKALVGAVLLSLLSVPAFASGVDNGIVTSQDGYAGGTIPIVTGNGSIAIGTHAVASGNNMTWEQLKAMMDEYNIKKENHDDLSTIVAGDVSDVNNAQQDYNAASTAAVAVQAARDVQAGYQSDLDTHNAQKPAIDNAYNTAKNEYETLYNDFQNRLNQIKYIDFSVYANGSSAGYDYNQMATDLKTNTETGTTFDMPVSFYYDYIQNYIKANGDLRENANMATSFVYSPATIFGTRPYQGNITDPYWVSGARDGWGGNETLNSYGTNITAYQYNATTDKYDPSEYKLSANRTYRVLSDFINSFDNASIDANRKFMSITFKNGSANDTGFVSGYGTMGIVPTDISVSNTRNTLKSYLMNVAYTDEQRNHDKSLFQSVYNNNLSLMTDVVDNLVQIGEMTVTERNNFMSVYQSALNTDLSILNNAVDVAYYQGLYESTGDIQYIGNKESCISAMDTLLKSNNGTMHSVDGVDTNRDFSKLYVSFGDLALNYKEQNGVDIWSPWQVVTRYFYNNVSAVQDATVVALRQVTDGLEGVIADKKQAYDDATAAKEANDNAITNLQNQIASLEPTPEQQALANELDQKAQDLQNAKDKFNADEQALQQAYQDMLDAQVGEIGEGAIAIGYNTITTGKNAIGMGTDAVVTAEEAIALGKGTVVSGQNSIGIGSDNSISQPNAIAIGTNNGITGANSIAIGNNNVISGANSIAIGNGLNISEDNVVALGGKKVSGVTNGTVATDAATVGQTYELVAGDGMSIVEDGTNAIGQKKFKLNSTATGGTTYTSGSNIVIEDDVISAQGLIKYDGADKKVATLEGGTRGTKLTNLATASLTRTSTDAVIGSQLWTTNSNLAGMQTDITTNTNNISALTSGLTSVNNAVSATSVTIDTLEEYKADRNLTNLTDVGRQVISAAAANAVQEYMAANSNGGATGNGLLGGMNTLSAPRPMGFGLMASPSTNDDIVTNNDLLGDSNDISMEVQVALDEKANISLNNINEDGVAVIRGALADDLALKADKEALEILEGQVVTNTGQIASLDGRMSSAENALDQVITVDLPEIRTSLDSKADKDSVYTKEETDTKLADKADIAYVDEGFTKKADKASVYSKSEVDTKLFDKANIDASNIDVDAWSKALGKGQVIPGDTGLVNGDTVFNSVMAVAQSNPVQAGENAIFIGKQPQYDGIGTIDVSNSKGEARVMTGVITNPEDMTSVANVGYVNAVGQNIMGGINQRFSQVDNKISDVGANAAAMSALMPVGDDADKKWSLSASVGHYDNSTASAVGLFYKPSDNVIVNVRGTVGSDENMLAGGVSVALDKGSVPGVSKAQLVRTVNAQAERLNAQDAQIAEMREEMARMAKRIEAQEKRK